MITQGGLEIQERFEGNGMIRLLDDGIERSLSLEMSRNATHLALEVRAGNLFLTFHYWQVALMFGGYLNTGLEIQ